MNSEALMPSTLGYAYFDMRVAMVHMGLRSSQIDRILRGIMEITDELGGQAFIAGEVEATPLTRLNIDEAGHYQKVQDIYPRDNIARELRKTFEYRAGFAAKTTQIFNKCVYFSQPKGEQA
jgi:hypothetical protein